MSLIQMSFTGGVLILAVIVLRAIALNRLPKWTFLALWGVAVLRLLAPFSIPSPVSVYALAESPSLHMADSAPAVPAASPHFPAVSAVPSVSGAVSNAAAPAAPAGGEAVQVWFWVWLAGAVACGVFFLLSFFRCRREFRTTLPVTDEQLQIWLAAHPLRRTVSIRQSDRIRAPLTYGLLRPVILLPKNWKDGPQLDCVLEHELAHIRYLDALWKPLLALAACVHWFNPLVWCMFVLANRDMELRCDEAVVRLRGLDSRSGYALTLISLEEKKSGLGPFASAFSKNAVEERIIAIMKIKKRSLAAILAAVVLVCCMGAAFATSAADKTVTPCPQAQDGAFTKAELDRLSELWFAGYEDMTVAAYQQKMWTEFDTPEDVALIDRYGQYSVTGSFSDDTEATEKANAFYDYFHSVYEPLTAERWQERMFMGAAGTRTEDGGSVFLEYTCTLHLLSPETLTVGEYHQTLSAVSTGVKALLKTDPTEEDFAELARRLSTDALTVAIEVGLPLRDYGPAMDVDAALHAQSSREAAAQWDEVLAPYVPFGLTYQFDDPDLDGNGLTMWWGGKEVRGICDEARGIWITEHTGNSAYSDGAVEVYTVYTNGELSGLRLAATGEQAEWNRLRGNNANVSVTVPAFPIGALNLPEPEEAREFPRATREDYGGILALRQADDTNLPPWASYPYRDCQDESLESFNQRLLDWANENPDAWDRINCDVIWNDCGVELAADERAFVSLTCALSGTENGMMVRALHTGGPEEDPGFSANMPERFEEVNGIRIAWCSLSYNVSYHIADKSAVTVSERDACVSGMMNAIDTFWLSAGFDALVQMTEADVVAQFNAWAGENSTERVRINPVAADDIFFEHNAEWGIE